MQTPAPAPSTTSSIQATPVTHYENFPVASLLCPAHLRAPIAAIYHFARTADDIADEGSDSAAQRLETFRLYRQSLQLTEAAAFDPSAIPTHWQWIFLPLQQAISQFALPRVLLHDLLDAFVQDVQKTDTGGGYENQAELLDYCRRSANPIGRLLLHLYGMHEPQALEESDDVCTALQLINFWQDISVDVPRGRFYLTAEDRSTFGVSDIDILKLQPTPNATKLVAHCAATARARMLKGSQLVHRIPGRAGWELRLVVQGGLRIIDKIEAIQFATMLQRPTLKWWDAPVMLWRALWM
jgi:squalene synthase HpnC